jgi:hypothetical protein
MESAKIDPLLEAYHQVTTLVLSHLITKAEDVKKSLESFGMGMEPLSKDDVIVQSLISIMDLLITSLDMHRHVGNFQHSSIELINRQTKTLQELDDQIRSLILSNMLGNHEPVKEKLLEMDRKITDTRREFESFTKEQDEFFRNLANSRKKGDDE